MKKHIVCIKLAAIRPNEFIVRRFLNEDNVLRLMAKYKSGVEIDPIEVVESKTEPGVYSVVDGRHRFHATERLEYAEIACWVRADLDTREKCIAHAMECNEGGALPPTTEDLIMVLVNLIKADIKDAAICRMLAGVYKPSLLRRYLDNAWTRLREQKESEFLNEVSEDKTTRAELLRKYSYTEAQGRDIINRRKRTKKPNLNVAALTRGAGNSLRSAAATLSALRMSAEEAYHDKTLTARDVVMFLEFVKTSYTHAKVTYADHVDRFRTESGFAEKVKAKR